MPAPTLNLRALIDPAHPTVASIPPEELTALLERLKTYAKRVHRLAKQAEAAERAEGPARRESSMPVEIAQVLYDLAGALALSRCGTRVIGLSDDRYRKNVFWLLSQPWLDPSLRRVFFAALEQLDAETPGLSGSNAGATRYRELASSLSFPSRRATTRGNKPLRLSRRSAFWAAARASRMLLSTARRSSERTAFL